MKGSANIYYNSGNVGIGTATVNNILQVGSGGRLRIANGATDYTLIGTSDVDANGVTKIILSGVSRSGDEGRIGYISSSTGSHVFYTEGAIERMRITSTGNVGIGTATPAGKLDINSGFVYIDGFKQPFSRTGTVNGVYYVDIPTLFELATTTVHTCEIVYTWYKSGSALPNANLYGVINGTVYTPAEVGYRDGMFSSSLAGYSGNVIVRYVEDSVDSTTKIRINRIQQQVLRRHHYTCDTVYCYAGTGSFINNSIGQFANGIPSTNQIQFIRIQLTSSTAYMYGSWTATYYHV